MKRKKVEESGRGLEEGIVEREKRKTKGKEKKKER